jgi:hypothetical protein
MRRIRYGVLPLILIISYTNRFRSTIFLQNSIDIASQKFNPYNITGMS